MTNNEKRFKILKKEQYEEEVSKLKKDTIQTTFLLGLTAAAAFLMLIDANQQNIDTVRQLQDKLWILFDGMIGAHWLKRLIQGISEKTMLQGKIEDIDIALKYPEPEENTIEERGGIKR